MAPIKAGVVGGYPSWWGVLWLAIGEGVMHAVVVRVSDGGMFVVFPVLICISTAALRQLFGSQDQTGILSNS